MLSARMRTVLGRCLGAAAVAAAWALAGCGHGNYTQEHLSAAEEKMAIMKSATEWEMARQSFLTGDFDKALKGVNRSLAISPKVAKSHVLKGRILMELSDLEGAIASFNEALVCDEKNVEATYHLGLVYERMLERDKALAQYQKASELDPQAPQYVIATAEMLIDLGRIDEARTVVESRTGAFANNAGVKQTLGHIAMLQDRKDDAVSLFNQARLLAPDDLTLIEDLTRAQVAAGKYGEAEANLSRLMAAEANAGRRDLKLMRARCLVEIDRPLEARELIIKLTQDDEGGSDVESWILLGNLSYSLKDANRTRLSAQRVIGLAPDRPEGYILRGLQQRRQGQYDAAAESFNEATKHDKTGNSLVLLGLAQRDMGNMSLAAASFREALNRDPSNAQAQRLLNSSVASVSTDD
ncbi:MAG: Beta-barrel assembly-enhancing protease [Phycisphaerales bacterium]|nr:Beta-barrel assembly-enhancing protease [Phycisphaerales bacterium]